MRGVSQGENTKGFIHSVETCGTVDGPGIRFVFFMQGCPLRCAYCHNPDTWRFGDGKEITAREAFEEARKYKSYMRFSGGGVTVTGGEPLMQSNFVRELFKLCRAAGIHTALDTSGYARIIRAEEVLPYTDLLLLDLKSHNPDTFRKITGEELDRTKHLLETTAKRTYPSGRGGLWHVPVCIRFVLVPGLNDDWDDIEAMGRYLRQFPNITQVDVLPFHKMGEYKWESLGYKYMLGDTQPPTEEDVRRAQELLALE